MSESEELRPGIRRITEAAVLSAMAHPFRARLIDALKVDGPSTASALSQRTGQAVGSVSHHLKVLSEVKVVEEVPELARDRRERWWRLVDAGWSWTSSDFADDPVAATAAAAAESAHFNRQVARTHEWLDSHEAGRRMGRRSVRDPELAAPDTRRAARAQRRDRRAGPALAGPDHRGRRRARTGVRLQPGIPEPAMTPTPTPVAEATSLRQNRNFNLLWLGEGVSLLGNATTAVLLPLLAVVGFDAGPGWMGALTAAAWLPWLVIGLPAGAWVDRLPPRRVMITSDLVAAAALASVPVAWATDTLTLAQLVGVALANGTCAVFFRTAYGKLIPDIVEAHASRAGQRSDVRHRVGDAGRSAPAPAASWRSS